MARQLATITPFVPRDPAAFAAALAPYGLTEGAREIGWERDDHGKVSIYAGVWDDSVLHTPDTWYDDPDDADGPTLDDVVREHLAPAAVWEWAYADMDRYGVGWAHGLVTETGSAAVQPYSIREYLLSLIAEQQQEGAR